MPKFYLIVFILFPLVGMSQEKYNCEVKKSDRKIDSYVERSTKSVDLDQIGTEVSFSYKNTVELGGSFWFHFKLLSDDFITDNEHYVSGKITLLYEDEDEIKHENPTLIKINNTLVIAFGFPEEEFLKKSLDRKIIEMKIERNDNDKFLYKVFNTTQQETIQEISRCLLRTVIEEELWK